MDAFPDLASLTDQGLKNLIHELEAEETHVSTARRAPNDAGLDKLDADVSYRLRVLRGKLEFVRGELVNRPGRDNEHGGDPGGGLSGVREPRRPTPQSGGR
jgi:hypothetical protein